MKNMKVCLLFLLLGFVSAENDGPCAALVAPKSEPAPTTLLQSDEYKVQIGWSDGKSGKNMVEYRNTKTNVSSIKSTDSSGMKQWINSNSGNLVITGSSCEVNKTDTTALGITYNLIDYKFSANNYSTLFDLIGAFKAVKFDTFGNVVGDFHDHDMADTHWMGCVKNPATNKTLQVLLCYPASNSTFKFPSGDGIKFPIKVELKEFDSGSNKSSSEYNFEFFKPQTTLTPTEVEAMTMPPPNVFCETTKGNNMAFNGSSTFAVHIQYLDVNGQQQDTVHVSMNTERRIVAYSFTKNKSLDIYFPQKASNNLTDGKRYTIIHDWYYGLEYIISDPERTCYKDGTQMIRKIPTDAGDSGPGPGTGTQQMLDPAHLLFQNPSSSAEFNFTNVGTRTRNGYRKTLSFAARYNTPNVPVDQKYLVVDVALTPDRKQAILMDTYHFEKAEQKSVSHQIFESFTSFAAEEFPWNHMSVGPCVAYTNESYLYLTINEEWSVLEGNGERKLENVLRTWIADKSNVSVLRVGSLYFKEAEAGANQTIVFFTIAEKSDVKDPAVVPDRKTENTVQEAAQFLNGTIKTNVTIVALKASVAASSLRSIPKEFHPSGGVIPPPPSPAPTKSGYSGGSMAAIALCMLIIGGVMGMVVAFFLWKRNRGIAYQVYE